MSRPAPRRPDRKGALAALAVAGLGMALIALVSLALDAILAARVRGVLSQAPPVTLAGPVILGQLTRWECRALTGGMWFLPLSPQLARLPLPAGVVARPVRGRCDWKGLSPVILTHSAL